MATSPPTRHSERRNGASAASKAHFSVSGARSPKKARRPAWLSAASLGEKEPAEETRQHAHGQEEAGLAGDPARPVRRQAAAGRDDVDVGMVGEREPQVCSTAVRPMRAPRCFGSAARVSQRLGGGLDRRS